VALRKQYHMFQALFAGVINVSPRTVQSWEQGKRRPSDAALRMLQVVSEEPKVVRRILRERRNTENSRPVCSKGSGSDRAGVICTKREIGRRVAARARRKAKK